MRTVLEDVARAADEVADEQREVAQRARAMQRERDRGRSWSAVLDSDAAPGLLGLLRASTRRLAQSAGRLAEDLAVGLSAEGESRRQIARRLGVTHQRITALLQHRSLGREGRADGD